MPESRRAGSGKFTHAHLYAVISRIPRGRVATYGQIAHLAGIPGHARLVGYALNTLPSHTRVPWHRVVNAKGGISLRSSGGHDITQRFILESEGVKFNQRNIISLPRFQWRPRAKRR